MPKFFATMPKQVKVAEIACIFSEKAQKSLISQLKMSEFLCIMMPNTSENGAEIDDTVAQHNCLRQENGQTWNESLPFC